MTGTLPFRRIVELGVAAPDLWPLLSQTDRINRAVNLPPVAFAAPGEGGLVRAARAKLYGIVPLAWDEPPFEWVENNFYSVNRLFRGGPFAEVCVGVRIFPSDGHTRLEIFADVRPRHALGKLLAGHVVDRRGLGDLEKLAHVFERSILDKAVRPFVRSGGRAPAQRELLAQKLAALRGDVDPKMLDALSGHLVDGFDEEVVRMRPFVLADKWGLDRLDVLSGFLHAAREGVLDVNWDILCPNCRVVKAEFKSLSVFRNGAHCETCNVDFLADFDKNLEVRFTVNPAIRDAKDQVFCIGGPSNAAHRCAQLRLGAGESRTFSIALPDKRLYARSLRGKTRLALQADAGAPAELTLEFRGGEPVASSARFRPGAAQVTLRNASDAEVWVAIDEEAWTDKAATAALVTSLQDFRDLFSSEVLSPGEEVSIRGLAMLFTDLKGSTALYERVGDAGAYALVRRHFAILMDAVKTYRGAVVKTIGDAVMAVFLSGEDALRAALAIQKRVHDFNQMKMDGREDVIVKLGIHMGPCIAVNSNDKLDYFGTTVNVAARVQNESHGGDVVISRSIADLPNVKGIIERRNCRAEGFDVALKGLSEKFQLWRIWPDTSVKEG